MWPRGLLCVLSLFTLAAFSHGSVQQSGGGANAKVLNVYGSSQAIRQNPAQYYVPGVSQQALSTSDWYHLDGVYWFRPYDLTNPDCGATGASIAAAKGRYFWLVSADHPTGNDSWSDGTDFRGGFSNDPGIPPQTMYSIFPPGSSLVASPVVATITGYIDNGSGSSGTVLHVLSVTGSVTYQNGANTVTGVGVSGGTVISAAGTGTGGTGTYTVNTAQLVGSSGSPITMTVSQINYALYQIPYLVCNPDDGSFPFYLFGEGSASSIQHEEGLAKSSDLINWTQSGPSHVNFLFNNWSSFERPVRDGVNSWHSTGLAAFFTQSGAQNVFGYGKWTSSNGQVFAPPGGLFNSCIPPNSTGPTGAQPCPDTPSNQLELDSSPDSVTVGSQAYSIATLEMGVDNTGSNTTGQYVARVPIDSSFNALASPAATNISNLYSGIFPGPTFVQATNAYVEDGIAHYYAEIGFFASAANVGTGYGLLYAPPATITGSVSGSTLTVTAATPGSIPIPGFINSIQTGLEITSQLTGTPGGVGTYGLNGTASASSQTIVVYAGGLWQEGIDYYTEIINATAAASAAPIGVQASCNTDLATLTWLDALPTRNYRVYRGTSAGSQPTLLATINDVTFFDPAPTDQSVNYYKVVTMNAGVEEKSRVVSTYCSSSVAFVNAHITRVLAAGATNINRSWLDSVANYLQTNNLMNDLLLWTDPAFGTVISGGVVQTVMDLGTTRLPRGGDYTTDATHTTYGATAVNGTAPGWINPASGVGQGHYGGPAVANGASGRLNNLRRLRQITLVAAYQKPDTELSTFIATGQFVATNGGGLALQQSAGATPNASFMLGDATHSVTATATISGSATAAHIIAGTFDGTNLCAYADGVSGTCQGGLVVPTLPLSTTNMDGLTGQIGGSSSIRVLGSGSVDSKYEVGTGYVYSENQAYFSASDFIVFDVALTSAQMAALTSLLKTHLGL